MRALTLIASLIAAALAFESGRAGTLLCANTLKVSVLANGDLLIDGVKSDFDTLDQRLDQIVKAKGAVWYYREAAGTAPTAADSATIDKTIKLIIKHRAPVSLSSKPDFSDTIDDRGNSTPRTQC